MLSTSAQAHHSTLAYFDPEVTSEIEGVVTSVHWSNPHIRFNVAVTETDGEQTEWEIELSALSSFRNRGYSSAFMQVGERVKVYGNPAKRGRPAMAGLNMLLENGTEVVLEVSEGPYYANLSNAKELEADASDAAATQRAIVSAEGIFRVWSTAVDDPDFPMFRGNYPLRESAAAARSRWVANEDELEACWSKGMPYLMITPQPIEFSRAGSDILMRFEEDDAQRLIHMDGSDASGMPSPFGYSVGAWHGDTLVVATTKLNSPDFDDRGIPQSEDMQFVERFTPSEDGDILNYQITITDPATFTEPFELVRTFVWRPERTIADWDCDA